MNTPPSSPAPNRGPVLGDERRPLRVCVLRHEPERAGRAHFDLLVEPVEPSQADEVRDVPTWRCARRPDRLGVGESVPLEPVAPHRRWWLGRSPGEILDLRDDLGTARVVASGEGWPPPAARSLEDAGRVDLRIRWTGESEAWCFRIETGRDRIVIITRRTTIPDEALLDRSGAPPCC